MPKKQRDHPRAKKTLPHPKMKKKNICSHPPTLLCRSTAGSERPKVAPSVPVGQTEAPKPSENRRHENSEPKDMNPRTLRAVDWFTGCETPVRKKTRAASLQTTSNICATVAFSGRMPRTKWSPNIAQAHLNSRFLDLPLGEKKHTAAVVARSPLWISGINGPREISDVVFLQKRQTSTGCLGCLGTQTPIRLQVRLAS